MSDPVVLETNVINYEPVFPVMTAKVLLDLPIENMVEDALAFVDNEQNFPGGFSSVYTDRSIDSLRGVSELKQAIYGVACSFGRELKYEANYDKSNIQLWLDVMRRDNARETWISPRGILAGHFVIRTEENYSPILLSNPTNPFRIHEPAVRPEDQGPFTAEALVIKPEVGVLYLWPAWMPCRLPPMTEPGPRISYGFKIDFLPPGA